MRKPLTRGSGDRAGFTPRAPARGGNVGGGNAAHRQYAGVAPGAVQRRARDHGDAYARGEAHRAAGGAARDPVFGAVQRQAVTDAIDAPREVAEDRATIDGPPGDSLSRRQVERARQRNPVHARRLGFSPRDFGSAAMFDTADFAHDVAQFQRDHGLVVDGIAGSETHAAATGARNQLEPGVLGAEDELEQGVLGAERDQLEDGLVGTDDPMFSGAAARTGGGDTLESGLIDEAVQGKDLARADDADHVHAAAARGLQGASQELPFRSEIEAATGHDLSGVKAHVGGAGAEASAAMGAEAYATGDHVVFAAQPDKHTAAHEAAHVLQQQAGVQLKGGVGQAGDTYERNADAVADRVVRGESARDLVPSTMSATQGAGVQHKRSAYGRRDHRGLLRLQLQRAASLARAGADGARPELACLQVAGALRHAVESVDVPGGRNAELTDIFDAADLAYQRAAELHGAASASLGDEHGAVAGLAQAMAELAGLLGTAGWRRPADARDGDRRAGRAQRRGRKDTFGSGDRRALIEASLATADHATASLTATDRPVTPQALSVVTTEAHRHIEHAFDVAIDLDEQDSVRGAVARHTPAVSRLEHEALRLNHRPEDLADTVGLANQLRARVGLAPLGAAELSPDEFARWLDAVDAFLGKADKHLEAVVTKTSNAYNQAWTNHTDVLKAQQRENLKPAMLEQALQIALVAGLGSVAAHVMKVRVGLDANAAAQGAIIDGVKDLTKAMAKKGVEVPVNVDAFAQIPLDPDTFRANAITAVGVEMRGLYGTLEAWRVALAQGLLTDRSFNPHALYVETLTLEGTPVMSVPVPNVAAESRAFELAFWRTWLESYAYTLSETRLIPVGVHVEVEQNWGDEIVDRINALGADGKSWIETYGGVSRTRANADKDRRRRELRGELDA